MDSSKFPAIQYTVINTALLGTSVCIYCRINKGVSKAYKMAMNNFTNTSLTSSCIIFTELLSRDSITLRVHLSAAHRLLKYHEQFVNDPNSISKCGHVISSPYMVLLQHISLLK